jgi:hypothetical protein
MWGSTGGARGGGHITIKIDNTDHLNLEHGACGKRMDIRATKPEYRDCDGGLKVTWFEVSCISCKTGWIRWRKTVLKAAEGEYSSPRRR